MSKLSNSSFFSGSFNLIFRVSVITGVCRSGKTLLGNLLATCGFVEHTDEPWLPMMLPVMVGQNLINEKLAQDMFITYTCELFNDMVLLRLANFRPDDLSSIWNQKTHSEIFARFTTLKSRSDVRCFALEHNSLLLYNLAETVPFINFFTTILPNCKLIHIVRKGLDVAKDVTNKHWFSDEQLSRPRNAQIYREYDFKGKQWYLPWWVKSGEENVFLNFPEFERAAYYWCELIERSIDILKNITTKGYCLTIRYEDLVTDPYKILNMATKFLTIEPTPLTQLMLSKIYSPKIQSSLPDISQVLYSRVLKLYNHFGYSIE